MMTTPVPSESNAMYLIQALKKLPGITKGFFAAMGLLGAAPQIIPFSALEIVTLVHAVIVGWNAIISVVWVAIANFLHLPIVPPEFISAAVLGFSLSSGWAYSIFISEWGQHKGFVQNAAFWNRVVIPLFLGPSFCLFVFTGYPSPLFWLALLPLVILLSGSLAWLPLFRTGFLTVFGFLGCLEVVYLVSTDAVRDTFDNFVCERQSVGLPQCEEGGEQK